MDKKTAKSKKNIVFLHNNFIEAIYSLSVDAKKLLLSIILHINKQNKISIHRNDILQEIGIDLKNLNSKHKEEIIEELMTKIITIKDINNPENWTKYQLLKATQYRDGILTTSIYPELLPYFEEAQKRLFTRFNIQNIKPLTSIYAIRIYELCKKFYKDPKHKEISIEELKKILQIQNKYKQISDFRKRVLEVAKRQINQNTDLEIDYTLIKEGRKYTKVSFKIGEHLSNISASEGKKENFEALRKKLLKLYKGKEINKKYTPNSLQWFLTDIVIYNKNYIRLIITDTMRNTDIFASLEAFPEIFRSS